MVSAAKRRDGSSPGVEPRRLTGFPGASPVHKTESEVREMLARKEAKLRLKAERRHKQEADVERKRRQREAQR